MLASYSFGSNSLHNLPLHNCLCGVGVQGHLTFINSKVTKPNLFEKKKNHKKFHLQAGLALCQQDLGAMAGTGWGSSEHYLHRKIFVNILPICDTIETIYEEFLFCFFLVKQMILPDLPAVCPTSVRHECHVMVGLKSRDFLIEAFSLLQPSTLLSFSSCTSSPLSPALQ